MNVYTHVDHDRVITLACTLVSEKLRIDWVILTVLQYMFKYLQNMEMEVSIALTR